MEIGVRACIVNFTLSSEKIFMWTIKKYRAGSFAIDFTQLEISVFYLVPKHFHCPNWVKSIAHDPAHSVMPKLSAIMVLFQKTQSETW